MADAFLNDPDALPIPMGVRLDTGLALPRLSASDAARVIASPDLTDAPARSDSQKTLAPDASVTMAGDLTQAGWAVLFASDADPAIKQQLQPLLDLRQRQVEKDPIPGLPSRFRIFEGEAVGTGPIFTGGVLPGQTADDWARARGVNFSSPVNPDIVPYYLLIVGSPDRISFDFHSNFKLQWLVGRLYFDDIADYGRYAAQVVAYETAPWKPLPAKNAAVWLTANQGDIATTILSGAIQAEFQNTTPPFGATRGCGYSMDLFLGEAATKQQLAEIFAGNLPGGVPTVVFTGSHGSEFAMPTTPEAIAAQKAGQGSLVTQEWTPGDPLTPACQFGADDIPAANTLPGTMVFMFACYSVGCPATDNYYFNADGSTIPAAPAPLISRLAQKLLANGALAVIGHVDRAFPYGIENVNGTSQVKLIRTPLERLMQGQTVGLAADTFSNSWSALSAKLGLNAPPLSTAAAARSRIARDDARNYVVLGDPAARLRVKDDSA
jgi:hypothetical protein